MLKIPILALAAALLLATGIAQARDAQTIGYGSDKAQRLDLHRADGSRAAPLILFVHGGGWTNGSKDNATGRHKAPHYTTLGYNFATIDYRLVPDATVEQQAQDVADALKHLLDRARPLGIDGNKVVLMGHSAGAHLVALVASDPQYLRRAGLSHGDVDGVILLDGAAYDVATQMEQARLPLLKRRYDAAFGKDPARQRALSPIHHSAAPNVPAWLILHVDRSDGREQSQGLAQALHRAGADAELQRIAGKGMRGHAEINRSLGDPDYEATAVVDRWLARTLAVNR